MAKSRPSIQKRNNEARKLEKTLEKAARRAARAADREETTDVPQGVDPDLAGIVPGPQPVREDPLAREDP